MGEARNGSMLALVGASLEDAREIADAGGVTVANDNAPGQVVLSGSDRATLDKTEEIADERKTRVIRLDVAGAFHSPAMAPAAEPVPRRAGRGRDLRAELHRLLRARARRRSRTSAKSSPSALIKPVRWRETVIALHEAGAPSFVEVGPGKVLARMGKRILKGVPFETPAEGLVHA